MRSLLLLDLAASASMTIDAEAVIAVSTAASLAGEVLTELCARARTFVDLGAVDDAGFDANLAKSAIASIAGVALPECRCGADIQRLAAKLAVAEAACGRPDGTLRIIAFVAGTPAGVLGVASIAGASARLDAVVFDGVRLAQSLPPGGGPFAVARAMTLIAAKAAGVPAYLPMSATDEAERTALSDGFAGSLSDRLGEIGRL